MRTDDDIVCGVPVKTKVSPGFSWIMYGVKLSTIKLPTDTKNENKAVPSVMVISEVSHATVDVCVLISINEEVPSMVGLR